MRGTVNKDIIEQLQKQILGLQRKGYKQEEALGAGLGVFEDSFPGRVFPRGAIHELISTCSENASSTSGFISHILSRLMKQGGCCLWISHVPRRSIFPPALAYFGIEPQRMVFVDTLTHQDTLWALEEALKCDALVAVVGELTELSFNHSRRLQLAVERSRVTGFIHRFRPKFENAVACVSRWKITALPSTNSDGLPGLGFPRWKVELLKVRNGQPGCWEVEFSPKGLEYLGKKNIVETIEQKTG